MQEVGPPNQQDAARDRAEVMGTLSGLTSSDLAVVSGLRAEEKRWSLE